jgi:opacity protein-like surface antigen
LALKRGVTVIMRRCITLIALGCLSLTAPLTTAIADDFVAPPLPPPPPIWDGFYAGASFGFGRLHARELDNGVNVFNFSTTSFSTFQNASGFGSSQSASQSTSLAGNSANLSGAQSGGIANVSLGFNWLLAGNFVSGVQVDGGLSNIQARLTGTGMSTSTGTGSSTSTSTFTSICPTCVPPNPTTTTTVTSASPPTVATGTQSAVDTVASRWFVSALARGGFLIDPIDLVYAIGGWTYAGFETPQNSSQFGLHGATIGGGVERQISAFWVIKAEYRYTKFQSKTLDLPSISINSSSFSSSDNQGGTNGGTSTTTNYINNTARFSPDMHVVYVGIARYF